MKDIPTTSEGVKKFALSTQRGGIFVEACVVGSVTPAGCDSCGSNVRMIQAIDARRFDKWPLQI
jgi:hypothetical protein